MRLSRNKYRMLYSALLIAAFFVPAYSDISALGFIRLALGVVQTDSEVTLVDGLVILIPLLFVPLSALVILLRAARQKPFNGILLSLPLFFLLFFLLILSFDLNRQTSNTDLMGLLKNMRLGFYLSALMTLLLLFTYRKQESLHSGSKP